MANFFSKQSIARLEPYIQSKVNQLTSKLRDAHHNGDTVVGVQAFGALTGDIIAYCVYGESLEDLDRPGFSSPLVAAVDAILITAHFRRFFPLVNNMIRKLPNWIVERVSPPAKTLLSFEHWIINMSIKTLDQQGTAKKPSVGTKTIFDLLTSPEIAPEEKSLKRLQDEGHMILIAGLVTTTRYLTNMVCWLVTYPEILKKLRRELATLSGDMDEKPTWTQLEGLPYLVSTNTRYLCKIFTDTTIDSVHQRIPSLPLLHDRSLPSRAR